MGARCITNAGGDHVDLSIEGVIGDGRWTDDPVTGASVGKLLKAAPNAKTLMVDINSVGGSFFDGVQIYQLLSSHPARVTVRIGAVAASAASVIAMAGDEIVAHETSNILVHRPWTWADGNEDDFRKTADDLATLNETLVSAYVARTGMSDEAIRALLIEDRYMGANEALKLGFLTSVLPSKAKEAVSPEQARASLDRLRAQMRSRQRPLAIAVQTTPAPSAKEKRDVNLALIIAALGIAASADETQAVEEIRRLKASRDDGKRVLDALGAKSADEAIGTVAALKGATERAETAERELAEMRASAEKSEREGVVAKLRAEGRVTPAQEKDLLPELSLTALKAFAASAPKVALLQRSELKEPGKGPNAGKKFSDLTGEEKAQLYTSDRETYNAMKQEELA